MTVWSDRLSSLELIAVLSLLDQGEALAEIAGPSAEPGVRKLVQGYFDSLRAPPESPAEPPVESSGSDPLEPRTERWSGSTS